MTTGSSGGFLVTFLAAFDPGDKVAIHWEGEPGDTRTITYAELLDEVSKFANVLKGLGVEKGDRVVMWSTPLAVLGP